LTERWHTERTESTILETIINAIRENSDKSGRGYAKGSKNNSKKNRPQPKKNNDIKGGEKE